ncbi:hypothetical protein HOY80DRAFT_1097354 [Tuber brumale]|nr:hypothetical protein HOY80DRAFT_1097354 [Tuber brumale]
MPTVYREPILLAVSSLPITPTINQYGRLKLATSDTYRRKHRAPQVYPKPILPLVSSLPVTPSINRMTYPMLLGHPGLAPLCVSLPLIAPRANRYKAAEDSPPTEDCPSTAFYPIPESLSPFMTPVSVPVLPALISLCSITIPPSSSSHIAGSVALYPAPLVTGSVALFPALSVIGSVIPSPTPLVTGFGPPFPVMLIVGSVDLSSMTLIAGFVMRAPTTLIAASNPSGLTTPVIALYLMTLFQVAAIIPTSPLVADTATVPIGQMTSPLALPPLHHLC